MGTKSKTIIYKIILLTIIQTVLGCNDCKRSNTISQFYEFNMKGHDVWRVPIVHPFELITAHCCRDYWTTGKELSEFLGYDTSVDSVNIINDNLILSCNGSKYRWIIANLKTKIVMKYEASQYLEYIDFLSKKNNTSDVQLIPVESIYNSWKLTGQLPWGNYIIQYENK